MENILLDDAILCHAIIFHVNTITNQEVAEGQTINFNLGERLYQFLVFILNYNSLFRDKADYTDFQINGPTLQIGVAQ